MSIQRLLRGCLALGMAGLIALPAASIDYPKYQDIQSRHGDPSPVDRYTGSSVEQYGGIKGSVAGAPVDLKLRDSMIDNYINQDEQINILPSDGTVKVLRTNQKNVVNEFVTAVIPINHAMRRELRNVFRRVTAIEGGSAEVFQDKRAGYGGSYMQVVAPPYMIPYLRDAVAALDVGWVREYDTGAEDLYIEMLHRDASDVDFIASNYAGGQGFSTVDTTNNAVHRYDEIYRAEQYADAVAEIDIPANQVELEVRVYEVAAGNDLKLGLDYVNWKNGPGRHLFLFAEEDYDASQRARGATSVFDPFINARATVPHGSKVKVVDTELGNASYRAVNYLLTSNFVDFLHSRREARIVNEQTLLLKSANTGVVSTSDVVLAFVANTSELGSEEVGPRSIRRFNGGTAAATELAGFGDFANGRVYVDENNDGVFTFGVDTILVENDWPSGVDVLDSDRRLHYESAGSVGMSLELTPYVGLESMELEVDLDIGELNGVAPNGTPIINTRTVSTTVRLLDGQPYVIAGLKRKNENDSTAKAPLLGSIPLLGALAGGEQQLDRETDVVIVIKPKFILSSQHRLHKSPRVETLDLIVEGEVDPGAPNLDWGYDQWLIGS